MNKLPTGSSAAKPDLDWSQIRETILMLNLVAAQVDFSLKDGTQSVDVLTRSFTSMVDSIRDVESGMDKLADKYQISDSDQQQVSLHSHQISEKMQQAIIAFQFYDTLVQRLDHVVNSLSVLADLVGDSSRLYVPDEWLALQEQIRDSYTMEKERKLFDAIIAGEDINSVIRQMNDITQSQQDEIELF